MLTRVRLGASEVAIPRLGFGGAPIGNLYRRVTDERAAATIVAAWDAGMRYFDTAPHYGLGLSERRLGAALAHRDRNAYVLSTKVGRVLEPSRTRGDDLAHGFAVPATHRRRWDFSRDGVLRSIEESLERLRVSRLDVVFLHDPDRHYTSALREGFSALAELRAQGMIGAIGAGMNQWQMLVDFVRDCDMDVVMLAGRYTLLEQPALEVLLPECARRGVSVVVAGPFNSGLLARPRPASTAPYDYRPAPPQALARAARIAAVCERHGVTLPQAALQFPLGHPAVAGVAVGVASPDEVRDNVARFGATVPDGLWDELRHEGLLHREAPVPAPATSR